MGEVSGSYGTLEGAFIKIKNDTSTVETYKTNRKGAFYFDLSYGSKYLISFSRSGYSGKDIIVDTKLPEKIPSDINQLITMKLELIEKSGESAQQTEPLGKVSYDRVTKEFSYESKYDKNSFTNIEVAGVDYYLSQRKKLGIPVDEEQENSEAFAFDKISNKQQKLEFFEKIKEKRNKLMADSSSFYKEENKEQNLVKEMPLDTAISSYSSFNMDIVEVILNNKKILRVYHRVKHDWGGVFYFKNYRAISKTLFYLETELKKKHQKRSTSVHSAFNSN
ncbi:MAG: hypothetical protein ACQESJ_05910 [Bacteroidota bacterium]